MPEAALAPAIAPKPAPTQDKEAVRVLAMAIGQREAARRLGLSPNTVKSICYRADEDRRTLQARADQLKPAVQSIAPIAPKPADILADTIADNRKTWRVGIAAGLAKVGKKMETADADEVMDKSAQLANLASVEAKSWPPEPPGSVRISVYSGEKPVEAIEIEASAERVE